ncbi:EF-hand calcium-binding domain-containing protein 4A isoform X2 [Ascaphus truei]|uniref:EF-hand calcium-binding domain-containing protein 4A isoform X2 n=1 Tax=Ascaphus truei TaxID=8439 RepID=UPI003F59871A
MEPRGTPRRRNPCLRGRKGYKTPPRISPTSLVGEPREMMGKAHEMFQLCDKEEKGLITKRDMQRLQDELPLTPEQLEAVFDSLDQNNNGYLTPVEFSMGLGKLLGVNLPPEEEREHSVLEETFESGWSDGPEDDDDTEMLFCATMEQLGAARVFQEHRDIRDLWNRLRREHPELLENFEEFLFRVSSHIRDVHHEKETLEQALKRKETDHGREVRCLYEEMEQQIKIERERLLGKCSKVRCPGERVSGCPSAQVSPRQQERHTALQRELSKKEQELDFIALRQRQLERQLHSINTEQLETRVQNDRLRQLNEDLNEQLQRTTGDLDRAQKNLQRLRKQEQAEEQRRNREVFKVSRNMQKEKQSLLRQLELLRDINKKFRDEKDVFEAQKLDTLKKTLTDPVSLPSCCCSHCTESIHSTGQ